jgi:hypothetical protein
MTGDEFAELAAAWWLRDVDAFDEVDRITSEQQEKLPSLIRALAACAPGGGLSYIGVTIMEDLADLAEENLSEDPAMEILIAADLPSAQSLEILSGPYPHYLAKWRIREHFASIFSATQLNALEDWDGRHNRRLMIDGDGVRLVDYVPW